MRRKRLSDAHLGKRIALYSDLRNSIGKVKTLETKTML